MKKNIIILSFFLTWFLICLNISDVFEDKSRGIFKLLDDVCKIQCQNTSNLVENIFAFWPNHPIIKKPKPTEIQQNAGFVIQHFAGEVLYDAVCTLQFYRQIVILKRFFKKKKSEKKSKNCHRQ